MMSKKWLTKQAAAHGLPPVACQSLLQTQKVCCAGGARGGKARLESDQMPRKALPHKACGERSEDFPAAESRESNGIFQAVKKLTRLFYSLKRQLYGLPLSI